MAKSVTTLRSMDLSADNSAMIEALKNLSNRGGWAFLLQHLGEAMAEDQASAEDRKDPETYIENLGAVRDLIEKAANMAEDLI